MGAFSMYYVPGEPMQKKAIRSKSSWILWDARTGKWLIEQSFCILGYVQFPLLVLANVLEIRCLKRAR